MQPLLRTINITFLKDENNFSKIKKPAKFRGKPMSGLITVKTVNSFLFCITNTKECPPQKKKT
jgi:hypothetical protein